jgi:hypothetical protein
VCSPPRRERFATCCERRRRTHRRLRDHLTVVVIVTVGVDLVFTVLAFLFERSISAIDRPSWSR